MKLQFRELDSKKLFPEMISYTFAATLTGAGKGQVRSCKCKARFKHIVTAFLQIYNKTRIYSTRYLSLAPFEFRKL